MHGDITLHLCIANDDHMMYGSWNIKRDRHFFLILGHFLPFYAPNNPENQNFEKNKRSPGDIIILHKSTINENHMVYGSWDMKCDRQNFLSFWTIFCHFTPLTFQKSKFLKSEKNALRCHHFTHCIKSYDQLM